MKARSSSAAVHVDMVASFRSPAFRSTPLARETRVIYAFSRMRSATMLIDYSSLLYRAFHSLPDSLPMQGVYGFLNMLARLITDHRPHGLVIGVDDDWRPAFRVDALPSYKAHRVATD